MTGNCPSCGALGTPGRPCPACGGHIPTAAQIEDVATIGRRTLAAWLATHRTGTAPILQHRGRLYAVCPPPGRATID